MSFYKFLNERMIGNMLLEYKCTPEFIEDLTPEEQKSFEKLMNKYYDTKKAKKDVSVLAPRFELVLKQLKNPKAKAKIEKLLQILKSGNSAPGVSAEPGDIKEVPVEDKGEIKKPEEKNFPESEILEDDYGLTDEFPLSKKKIEEAFNLYNQLYFNNSLKPIPFKVGRTTSERGCFCYHYDLKNKQMIPLYIKISNKGFVSIKTFRNTMVHEMLHYYVHCIIGHSDFQWNQAISYLRYGQKKKALAALESTDETCHNGKWYELAKEMNEKYPELTIKRWSFGSNGIYERDKESYFKKIRDKYNLLKNSHLISTLDEKEFYVINDNCYNELKDFLNGKFDLSELGDIVNDNSFNERWVNQEIKEYKIKNINDFETLSPDIVTELKDLIKYTWVYKMSNEQKRYLGDFADLNNPKILGRYMKESRLNRMKRQLISENDYSDQFKEYIANRNNLSEKRGKWSEEELEELGLDLDDLSELDDEIGFIEIQ